VGSARFLKLPSAARLLYYDLGMDADDDGVVEAFAVLRKSGAGEEDLQLLVDKGFLLMLDEENLVVHICHWGRNNMIRHDRYHPSVYLDLLRKKTMILGPRPDWVTGGERF
jgi:hypothetical protein